MKPFRICVILAIGLMTSAAEAQTYQGVGKGKSSCGTWTADRRHRQSNLDEQWILGFLSGIGYKSQSFDPLKGMDVNAVWAWMDNYCQAHTLDSIAMAGAAFDRAHPR